MKLYQHIAKTLHLIQNCAEAEKYAEVEAHKSALKKTLQDRCPWWNTLSAIEFVFNKSTLDYFVFKLQPEEESYLAAVKPAFLATLDVRILDVPQTREDYHDYVDYLGEALYCFLTQQL